jgi:hypothetical protein
MAQGITPITSGDPITGATDVGADGFFEPVRASLVACTFDVIPLGGSRTRPLPEGGGYMAAIDYIDFYLPHADYGGGTWEVIVETRVENVGISLTPRLYNITDASSAVVGSASTSTTGSSETAEWAQQVLSVTPTAAKKYRLMGVKSADTYAAFLIGWMRRKQ